MGSALGLTLANAFFVYFEKNWLQNCLSDFEPYYYRQHTDDIFILFTSPHYLEGFRNFLNGGHAKISLTIESEKQKKKKMSGIMKVIDERETQRKTKSKDRKERGRQKL